MLTSASAVWRTYAIVAPDFVVEVSAPSSRDLMAAMWFMCRNAYDAVDPETGEVVVCALPDDELRAEWLGRGRRRFDAATLSRVVASAVAVPFCDDDAGKAEAAAARCRAAAVRIRGLEVTL